MNERFFLWLETRSEPELRITLGRKPCLFDGLYFIIDTEDEKVKKFEVCGDANLSLILSEQEIGSFNEDLIIRNSCKYVNRDVMTSFIILITATFLRWLEKGNIKDLIPLSMNPVEDEYLMSDNNLRRLFLYFNVLEKLEIKHCLLSIQKFILSKFSYTISFENRLFIETIPFLNKKRDDIFPEVLNEAMNKLNFVNLLTSRNFDIVTNIGNSVFEQIKSRDRSISELERKVEHLQSLLNILMRNYRDIKSNERI